jgi:hypothetical protein
LHLVGYSLHWTSDAQSQKHQICYTHITHRPINNYKWKVPTLISSHCHNSTRVVNICTTCCKIQRLNFDLSFQSCVSYDFFQGHCLICELRPWVPCVSQLNDNRQVCVLRNSGVHFRFRNSAIRLYSGSVYLISFTDFLIFFVL